MVQDNPFVVIPLVQPERLADSQGETVRKGPTKGSVAKAEAILINIRLHIAFEQTVVRAQDVVNGKNDHTQKIEN